MASIRARTDNGLLFFDFRYNGVRCREQTALEDTKANRQKMEKVLKKIEEDIAAGTFDYRRYFPTSKLAEKFDNRPVPAVYVPTAGMPGPGIASTGSTPFFKDFCKVWFNELSIGWRRSYKNTVQQILDQRLIPTFGDREVGSIRREEVLAFRSTLAKEPGRKKDSLISPRRINAITLVLKQVLNEAADRYNFSTQAQRIKPLKVKKTDVHPFTLQEVQLIISKVRPDFRNYYTVRFFTGMRTGEIGGLKWKYVDFERRLILIRETFTWGEEDYTKNDTSQRDIQMSGPVYEALKAQKEATGKVSEYVFCNQDGKQLDVNNVSKRVWYPILRHLGIELRNPYQTRHTAATLWLAAGEAPEWIARQLGHANTEMLFRVYSRYVPNLTRRDGSAFERLLLQSGAASTTTTGSEVPETTPAENNQEMEVSHG